MKYTLIPGLTSFMEDTEVNVEVAVDAPEAIEEAEETADASAEIAETTEEAEATDEQTEMILHHFADLERQYNHVKQYGVDRTFMRLFNSNNELTRAVKYRFPSCESFSSTGDPYSRESIACMEGLGSALSAIWDFVVNLCKKIGAFFGRLFEAIRVRFGNLNDQIGRLREMASERTSWVDNIDDVDATTYQTADVLDAIGDFKKMVKDTNTKNNVKLIPKIEVMKDWCKSIVQQAKIDSYHARANDMLNGQNTTSDMYDKLAKQRKEEDEHLKALRKAFKEAKKEANKIIDGIKDNVYIKSMPLSDIKNFLDGAATIKGEVDKLVGQQNLAKTTLQIVQTEAENMKRRQDDSVETSKQKYYATALASGCNLMNQSVSFQLSFYNRIASICVRAASKMLQYCKKP